MLLTRQKKNVKDKEQKLHFDSHSSLLNIYLINLIQNAIGLICTIQT